jgi:hypothetical protein
MAARAERLAESRAEVVDAGAAELTGHGPNLRWPPHVYSGRRGARVRSLG